VYVALLFQNMHYEEKYRMKENSQARYSSTVGPPRSWR